MRTTKRVSLIAVLICIAMLLFTGCEQIESVKKATSNEADILETAYFYDQDTDTYRTVLIIQNNTMNPIKTGYVTAKAYDENGERIEEVKDGPYNYALMGPYYWLGTNEKAALIFTNDGIAGTGTEFSSILDHYTAVPATLEWESEKGARQDPNQLPHGLSVTSVEPPYSSDFTVTIHNDSENDYTSDEGTFEFTGGGKRFRLVVVAIYRDAEGKICDAQELKYGGYGGSLPAGGDGQIFLYTDHTVSDESLTPEYYISIIDLTDEAGE